MPEQKEFANLKKQLVQDNEAEFGQEIRQNYGDDVVEQSNAKLLQMSEEGYAGMQQLSQEIICLLEQAVAGQAAPSSPLAQRIVRKHKEWLCYSWDFYDAEAHKGVAQLYVDDARFTQYYDRNVAGCASFLREAILAVLS